MPSGRISLTAESLTKSTAPEVSDRFHLGGALVGAPSESQTVLRGTRPDDVRRTALVAKAGALVVAEPSSIVGLCLRRLLLVLVILACLRCLRVCSLRNFPDLPPDSFFVFVTQIALRHL